MIELKTLAERHKIENELYYGRDIQTFYKVMGYKNRFIRLQCELKPNKEDCCVNLVEVLKQEIKFQEELILQDRLLQKDTMRTTPRKKRCAEYITNVIPYCMYSKRYITNVIPYCMYSKRYITNVIPYSMYSKRYITNVIPYCMYSKRYITNVIPCCMYSKRIH